MVIFAIALGAFLDPKILSGEKGKHFKFLICKDKSEAKENQWYRLEKWKSPNLLVMKTSYSKDWKTYYTSGLPVVGVTKDNRTVDFILMGDQEDFQIYLEREPDNPVDPNAIKIMGKATVKGELWSRQIGYLAKETAADLKEEDLDARPDSVYLPYGGKNLGLTIRVLIRSQAYKKKKAKQKKG